MNDNAQPEALRLADEIEEDVSGCPGMDNLSLKAAAELRRLHEVCCIMRRTLECISHNGKIEGMVGFTEWAAGAADAAIAKAEGGAAADPALARVDNYRIVPL